MTERAIRLLGVATHNLRSIDVAIPVGRLTVVSGVSGSGKSSLALDTLFAEGQRRYLESLSPGRRRQLRGLPRPDVLRVEGLPPTLAVRQSPAQRDLSRRHLVATQTGLAPYLRLLLARCGAVHCPQCGRPLATHALDDILADVLTLPEGERIHVLAPLVRARPGDHREQFLRITREGFMRARVDGVAMMIDGPVALDPEVPHTVEMVVDRQVVRAGAGERLRASLQTALKHGGGTLTVARTDDEGDWLDVAYSTRPVCPHCDVHLPDVQPRHLDFHSPHGACPACEGLGEVRTPTLQAVWDRPELPIGAGGLVLHRKDDGKVSAEGKRKLSALDGSADRAYAELSAEERATLWRRLAPAVDEWLASLTEEERDELADEWPATPCPECGGSRLGPVGRSVRLDGRSLADILALDVAEALRFVESLTFAGDAAAVARPLTGFLAGLLAFLAEVGLGYLTLDRPSRTLSGGEAQRTRLAGCLGTGLTGACYVLDEPTAGLHAADVAPLVAALARLRDTGNTVVVVEHDRQVMEAADHLIDIGPGAGSEGGRIVNGGPPAEFLRRSSPTADYLNGRTSLDPERRAIDDSSRFLRVAGIRHRNLRGIDVSLPLNRLVAVTGVSGSGKSSLVAEVLVPLIRRRLRLGNAPVPPCDGAEGLEHVTRLVQVTQAPVGRSPRSTPASYTGILAEIRKVMARTKDARVRGYTASRFSPTSAAGRCEFCKGLGAVRSDSRFLPDVYATCPRCGGRRFNRATLAVRYRDRTVAGLLDLTVAQAGRFFDTHPVIGPVCHTLQDVGLGYLTLGQWGPSLSGGEAQRLKLGRELGKAKLQPTLFVLDEPTTGLHPLDVARLHDVLRRLVRQGHSILMVEHDVELIAAADWVIDLGPGGGPVGGRILHCGPPDDLPTDTPTGRVVRHMSAPPARNEDETGTAEGAP